MEKIICRLGLLIEHIIMVLLIVLVSLTFTQVIFRYVFSSPLVWSEEVIRYCLIWIVLLGAGLGLKDNAHIGIEFVIDLLPRAGRLIIAVLNILLISAAALFLVIVGSRFALQARGSVSPAMGLPNILVFAAMPISAVTWLIFLAGKFIEAVRRFLGKEIA